MTVFLRALYGPFARTERAKGRGDHCIDWHFFGIRENNTMGRWALRFLCSTREFKTVNFQMDNKRPLPELVNTYVHDRPMLHGPTYADVLRTRLSHDDIAFMTRRTLEARR